MKLINQATGLNPVAEKCDRAFRQSLPESFKDDAPVSEALRYCLRHPGALVRAQLAYQTCLTVGINEDSALQLATGVEYLHTASLLFDDLPCMDDAMERRGFPTVHAIYAEDSAILAALALVNRGYTLLWSAMQDQDKAARLKAAEYLDRCLGVCGILGGQSRDVHMTPQATSVEVIRVAYGKTVSLVKMAMAFPAMLGSAGESRDLELLATYWGLAYQVSDDLKDVCASSQSTGKTVRQDAGKGRPNIAVCEGVSKAVNRMFHYVAKGDAVLERLVSGRREWVFLSAMRKRFEDELAFWQHEAQELSMTGTQ
ncbi:MAG: polyprenyl synthetase family protein [Akkermansiaceae bacterium]|nr:polyprenyl synthetase family protein [Akkermansiaceae bacterium]